MTKKVFYVFDCGCTLEKQNVVKIKGSMKCPSHPQSLLLERFSFCADCGAKVIQKKSKGEVPRRCSKHKKEYYRRNAKRNAKRFKEKEKNESGIMPPVRRPDCKWYFSHCLQLGGKLLNNSNACEGCLEYEYQLRNGLYVKFTRDGTLKESQMECNCSIDVHIDSLPSFVEEKTITARRNHHICGECGEQITPGQKYEYVRGVWDAGWETHKTCLDCLSVREQFFTYYVYGEIWNDLEETFKSCTYKVSEQCISNLTPAAWVKVCELIETAWE